MIKSHPFRRAVSAVVSGSFFTFNLQLYFSFKVSLQMYGLRSRFTTAWHSMMQQHDHATTRPRNNTTTQQHDHATTRPRNNTTTQQHDHATTRPRINAYAQHGGNNAYARSHAREAWMLEARLHSSTSTPVAADSALACHAPSPPPPTPPPHLELRQLPQSFCSYQ
jgi:hypothetical protein